MESAEGKGLLIAKEELRLEAAPEAGAGLDPFPGTKRHCGLCYGQDCLPFWLVRFLRAGWLQLVFLFCWSKESL